MVKDLYFVSPTSQDYLAADRFVAGQGRRYIQDGVPTQKEMDQLLLQKGLFTISMHQRIKDIRKQLSFMTLKRQLYLFVEEEVLTDMVLLEALNGERMLSFHQKEWYEEELTKPTPAIYDELLALIKLRQTYYEQTVEQQIEKMKTLFLIAQCVYQLPLKTRLWTSYESLAKESNALSLSWITLKFQNFLTGFPAKVMRKIVRNSQWSFRWMAATKTGTTLFPAPVIDWNTNQLSLCYWSMFYDNIAQYPDAPIGERLDDDEWVDAWLKTKALEREKAQPGATSMPAQIHKGQPSMEHHVTFKRR